MKRSLRLSSFSKLIAVLRRGERLLPLVLIPLTVSCGQTPQGTTSSSSNNPPTPSVASDVGGQKVAAAAAATSQSTGSTASDQASLTITFGITSNWNVVATNNCTLITANVSVSGATLQSQITTDPHSVGAYLIDPNAIPASTACAVVGARVNGADGVSSTSTVTLTGTQFLLVFPISPGISGLQGSVTVTGTAGSAQGSASLTNLSFTAVATSSCDTAAIEAAFDLGLGAIALNNGPDAFSYAYYAYSLAVACGCAANNLGAVNYQYAQLGANCGYYSPCVNPGLIALANQMNISTGNCL